MPITKILLLVVMLLGAMFLGAQAKSQRKEVDSMSEFA